MSFQKILEKYRAIAFSERDKGERFERLIQAYLKTDSKYAFLFKNVWLWNEFPGKLDLGGNDIGIDLVALTYEGEYWAIQCKCYQENSVIDKSAVDSFISTSSRAFKNEQMQTTRFAHRLWVSTTNKWGTNATETIRNQNPPVTRINLFDLMEAPVDWEKLEQGIHGEAARTPKKAIRKHQKEALEKTHQYFKIADRGKLIMACGTGKTFTALRIAENETLGKGMILFLVPSIALLGQSLREWSAESNEPINAVCICSDPEVSKEKTKNLDTDTFSVIDLALPASTDVNDILHQFQRIKEKGLPGMTVVFSTYQSIDVISKAQKVLLQNNFGEFDLIVCDEAHRTTGAKLQGEEESSFVKVHDNQFVKAKKRLYMTATPRMYNDEVKSKAAQNEVPLWSMDRVEQYGDEIYRIGFGEAVERDLLTDYKVLILTLNDRDVPPAVQKMIASKDTEINTDDASKIIGTINALSKQFLNNQGLTVENDPEPMRRALAFCQNISVSKKITDTYNNATEAYIDSLPSEKRAQMVSVEARHVDGTMPAPQRDELLGWLKAETKENECRILTNVRCLSEGVDVPSLDAVLFLSARNSPIEVVQSVGRVMRKAPGKKYGYIIIPVVVPADVEADKALDDNERYKVVWTVLNALRAHDDRFNATINKIELNKRKPDNILIGRPEISFDEFGNPIWINDNEPMNQSSSDIGQQMALQFEQLQSIVFARLVQKVGDRKYWEQWAKGVAVIAERQIERIQYLITEKKGQRIAFEKFLLGLQKNINPRITEPQAVEMLAQHIITKPIFEALFEGYSFVKHNAVSVSMQHMLDELEPQTLVDESESLQKFYDFVRRNASGIDNAKGKQEIIIRLYDNFFKSAFPKMVEQLGIVYTPVEVVDFIIHSVNDVLKKEFNRSISDENVHILDPFSGTGTFIARLLQSGLIETKDLAKKYRNELHANEIVLLAYYIAAVNIENTFHDQLAALLFDNSDGEIPYEPFEGMVLTDTFQLGEANANQKLFSDTFPQNSERVDRQKKSPLRVIMGNPPYSIGQKSANDNAQNQKYEKLDGDIAKTYAKLSSAGLNKSLYDAYIKAFRWSTDRLDPVHGGIIAFVSNGAWLEGNSTDGFRKSLEKEFSSIWVFNLRGNQRTNGELSRKEGGKIFGAGSRTPIAITLLVKNPEVKTEKAAIYYHDIGDYLKREEKLKIIGKFRSVSNPEIKWEIIEPNIKGDWLNPRNDIFDTFIPMAPIKKFDTKSQSFFITNVIGASTNRDAWVYNFSRESVQANMRRMVAFYNKQQQNFKNAKIENKDLKVADFIDTEPTQISWTRSLRKDVEKGVKHVFNEQEIRISTYRPFTKLKLYFDKSFIESPGLSTKLFPTPNSKNRIITITGVGASKEFSVIMTDAITNLDAVEKAQSFPLHFYEEREKDSPTLFDSAEESAYTRRDGVSDFIFERAKKQYGKNVTKEDIFYYVYGILHSPDYLIAFANDFKKMLPRIPLIEDVRDFWKFSNAGRKLADLHTNYESIPPYEGLQIKGLDTDFYTVEKMRFSKKGQTDTIIYNSKISVSNIPARAYEYTINGKSAIEWIMERYQVKIDPVSNIKNDPNEWAKEENNPRYIFDLLLSLINVSMQTVDVVKNLPPLTFEAVEEPEIYEHDLILTKSPIGNIPVGTVGTVVHIYDDGQAYEVEFVTNNLVSVETVLGNQIERKP